MSSNFLGQLDIRLTTPYGTESIFASPHGDTNPNYTGIVDLFLS